MVIGFTTMACQSSSNLSEATQGVDTVGRDINPTEFFIPLEDLDGLNSDGKIVDGQLLASSLPTEIVAQEQIEALRDGQVSLEEFTELVRIEVECVRAAGLDVTDVQISEGAFDVHAPSYGFRDPVTDSSSDSFELQSTCQRQYSQTYQQIFYAENLPSVEEQESLLVREAQRYVDCAEEYDEAPPFEVLSVDTLPQFFTWYAQVGPIVDECTFEP